MNQDTVRILAMLAEEAYNPPEGSLILRDGDLQCRGFVIVGPRVISVAISGTKSVQDARTDIDVRKEHVLGGRVHMGFWREYETFRETLQSIFKASEGRKKIRLTGHSLGAILAIYAAEEARTYTDDIELVTLGCPKGIDRTWRRNFEKKGVKHVRVVHAYDLIPHVPPFGFCHTGRAVVLDDSGHRLGPVHGHWRRLVKIAKIFWAWLRGRPIHDHHVGFYVQAIKLYFLNGGSV